MADVEKLLAGFADELRETGEADPMPYLRQVEGADRRELAALIDAHLENAPRREWDPAAFSGSAAERVASRLEHLVEPGGESLPELLPRLRHEREMPRSALTERLAGALGFADRRQKVAHYYHQLEQGLLPASGVSPSVFEALGSILGESADRLRRAAAGSAPGGQASSAFARTTAPAPASAPAASAGGAGPAEEEWDEVDELFQSPA